MLPIPRQQLGHSDEIVFDYGNPQILNVGDFNFSPTSELGFELNSLDSICGTGSIDYGFAAAGVCECEIQTGTLWKYLKSQGVESTDRLVFYIDMDSISDKESLSLNDFQFTISDRDQTHVSKMTMSRDGVDDRILIPGYETGIGRPEAMVEVILGYDFMSKYSDVSTDLMSLRSETTGQLLRKPEILIAGKTKPFGWGNTGLLIGFVAFWLTVFSVLRYYTFPNEEKAVKHTPSNSKTNQAA